jgi:hypothetical protein
MTMLRPRDPAFAGGANFGGTEWRLSRPAVLVSLLAHLVLLLAVGRVALDHFETLGDLPTAELVWLDDLVRPSETPEPAPVIEEPIAAPPEPVPAPRAASPRPPPITTTESPPIEETAPPAPAESPPLPSRLELDAARREAVAALVEEHARADKILKFSLDDVVPARAAAKPKQPSIFDHQASAGSGVLSPAKARTALGFKARMWCNRVTGGGIRLTLGLFSIPACMSGTIGAPSGLFVESIPEYMTLKPECEETRPLAAALGETSPYPTVKCRLVPKDADEAAVLDDETGR